MRPPALLLKSLQITDSTALPSALYLTVKAVLKDESTFADVNGIPANPTAPLALLTPVHFIENET
tara:strand:- start:165 stop:359 length:195 start_codon:yes stop_codon:yes gene_type:complete